MKPPSDYASITGVPSLAESTLAAWDLGLGIDVEVEVLTLNPPRIVEGRIVDATANVLVLETRAGRRRTRIPWAAIAIARAALTDHPAI